MSRLSAELRLRRAGFDLQASFCSETGRLALLGPSGAGKSTILECLAGLQRPDAGRIEVAGDVLLESASRRDVPARRRRIGLVTQQGALFPHLTLLQNLDFALSCLPRAERPGRHARHEAAARGLEAVGLGALAGRLPNEVSGGEARRAELARALVARPRLVLLDEPFSALDPATKAATVAAFRDSLTELAAPWVLVTHDRDEALGLADEVGIVVAGRVRQVGTAHEVFLRPADAEVAAFLGSELAWEGEVLRAEGDAMRVRLGEVELSAMVEAPLPTGTPVVALLRPEDVTLWNGAVPPGGSSRNHLQGRVLSVQARGLHVLVRLDAGIPLAALLTRGAAAELEPEPGRTMGVSFKATRLHLIERSGRTAQAGPASAR
jgi:molybdate transport system ATP-binding protein